MPPNKYMIMQVPRVPRATFTPESRTTYDQCRQIFMAWSGMIGKKITRVD